MAKNRIVKVITWRMCSIIITLVTTWLYTGSLKKASTFTIILHVITITAHYGFETFWDRELPEEEIEQKKQAK